jgi:hypothetical protein
MSLQKLVAANRLKSIPMMSKPLFPGEGRGPGVEKELDPGLRREASPPRQDRLGAVKAAGMPVWTTSFANDEAVLTNFRPAPKQAGECRRDYMVQKEVRTLPSSESPGECLAKTLSPHLNDVDT